MNGAVSQENDDTTSFVHNKHEAIKTTDDDKIASSYETYSRNPALQDSTVKQANSNNALATRGINVELSKPKRPLTFFTSKSNR